ncbi:hypothetical protein HDU79_005474 [Rhizoclosmatium sp. JEL0117]|nr:hypothetical protein HDU79_005474 [Rhizoclosmatium sp. JEL0117]
MQLGRFLAARSPFIGRLPPSTGSVRSIQTSATVFGRLRHANLAQTNRLSRPPTVSAASLSPANEASTSSTSSSDDSEALLLESLPTGVSLGFYRGFLALTDALDQSEAASASASASGLRGLASLISGPSDAALFKDAAARWRRHKPALPLDFVDVDFFFAKLVAANAHAMALTLALNPFKYGLHLSASQIHVLLDAFSKNVIASNDDTDLDNLYKAFALLLHTNVSPTLDSYYPLIAAGAYSDSEEAWARALVCINEVEFLFSSNKDAWTPNLCNALVYAHLKKGDAQKAVDSLSAHVHPLLRAEALTMNGDALKAASVLLETPSSQFKIHEALKGSDYWSSLESVRDTIVAELEESNKEISEKVAALVV